MGGGTSPPPARAFRQGLWTGYGTTLWRAEHPSGAPIRQEAGRGIGKSGEVARIAWLDLETRHWKCRTAAQRLRPGFLHALSRERGTNPRGWSIGCASLRGSHRRATPARGADGTIEADAPALAPTRRSLPRPVPGLGREAAGPRTARRRRSARCGQPAARLRAGHLSLVQRRPAHPLVEHRSAHGAVHGGIPAAPLAAQDGGSLRARPALRDPLRQRLRRRHPACATSDGPASRAPGSFRPWSRPTRPSTARATPTRRDLDRRPRWPAACTAWCSARGVRRIDVHAVPDASKIALAALVAWCRRRRCA